MAAGRQPWEDLVKWIQNNGGKVHESLALKGSGPSRGVTTTHSITKGSLLVRLPASCVLDGSSITPVTDRVVSSWLRCIAAFYRVRFTSRASAGAKSQEDSQFEPYLRSLPEREEYETLFNWTDEQLDRLLKGTALGTMAQQDRESNMIVTRYRQSVRPFLAELYLVSKDAKEKETENEAMQEEIENFKESCMCLSTRGFHLKKVANEDYASDESKPPYEGPFLLPLIDLLNHDDENPCTTLERNDTTGDFIMVAERDISLGEGVMHAYGKDMASAQILQTFGFVPKSYAERALASFASPKFTSSILSKDKHLLPACKEIKASKIPKYLQQRLQLARIQQISRGRSNDDDDDDDDDELTFWNVAFIPERRAANVPDDVLISADLSEVPDQLCTLLSAQFAPQDVFDEVFDDDTLLDSSALEDFYLGNLVARGLLLAIHRKMAEFTDSNVDETDLLNGLPCAVPQALDNLISEKKQHLGGLRNTVSSNGDTRAMYGVIIQIEELRCLRLLARQSTDIIDDLDSECPKLPTIGNQESSPKRQKTK